MATFKDLYGKEHEVGCIACAMASGAIDSSSVRIHESEHFLVEQDIEYPIPGFLIVTSKRHAFSIDSLSEAESLEYMQLLRTARPLMRNVLGIDDVTMIQEESTSSSHFHTWLFPWHSWMNVPAKKIQFIADARALALSKQGLEARQNDTRQAVEALRSAWK